MKVVCLGCGHKLDLGDSYDDYNGPLRCNVCRSLMSIKSEGGKIRSSSLIEDLDRSVENKR